MSLKKIHIECYPHPRIDFLYMLYREAFGRLGIEFTIRKDVPIQRCSIYSDKVHPNLVKIEKPHFMVLYVAYSARPDIRIDGWDSLKDTGYIIEYERGTQYVINRLEKIVPEKNISIANSRVLGFRKLIKGRSDIFIVNEGLAGQVTGNEEFKNSGIRKAGILEEVPAHLYLHRKFESLVPKLEAVLEQMDSEGLYDEKNSGNSQ